MWSSGCLLAVLTLSMASVSGYSNGKVSEACGDMVPQHGHESSQDPPLYSLTVDKAEFSPGQQVTVSLSVLSSNTFFRGFLIEAKEASHLDSPAKGFFTLTDQHKSQSLQCSRTKASAVSHRGNSRKTHIQVVWESQNNPPPKVQFLVTVVQEYSVFWVRMAGPVVSLRRASLSTTVPVPTASPSALSAPFSAVGCGHSKSCLRDPVGCHPESNPLCFFLSFTTEDSGLSVMFELSGPADGYLSFALSMDKLMGNDKVFLCVRDGSKVSISARHLSGRRSPQLEAQDSLWGRAWRLIDGVIQCRFHRNIITPNRLYLNQSYFLFLAHGHSYQGLIYKHGRQPLISINQKLITGDPENLSGSRSPLLIKFHGVLMLTAWMWLVSSAVLLARHYKHLWPHTTLLRQKLWFQLHRTMMALAGVVTSVAFSLPFIYRRGLSTDAGSHPFIGCMVLALSVIQIIMATLRPAPGSPRRIVFNWMHFGVGSIGQVLAAVCVFQGPAQQALLLPSSWAPAVLIGWLLWILLADVLLLIHSYRLKNRVVAEEQQKIVSAEEERHLLQVSKAKKTVVLVFLIGNTGFLAAFILEIVKV